MSKINTDIIIDDDILPVYTNDGTTTGNVTETKWWHLCHNCTANARNQREVDNLVLKYSIL